MKIYIIIFTLLAICSCANNNLAETEEQTNTPIEFNFSGSSFTIVDSKRQGVSGKNFEIGDTLLIGQYRNKTDNTRDNSSVQAACYYTVTGFDETSEKITSIAPVSTGTPLTVLSSADSHDGKAFYTILSGGNGKAFPLSVFNNVDGLYALDYENMNYNYDILTQSTSAPSASSTINFESMEHLLTRFNIKVKNSTILKIDSVTYQDIQLTKEFTPVYSSQVDYVYNNIYNVTKGYKLMHVTDEGEGIDYRAFILPTPTEGDQGTKGTSFIAFYYDNNHVGRAAMWVPLEAGLSYSITVVVTGPSEESKMSEVFQIEDISVEPY